MTKAKDVLHNNRIPVLDAKGKKTESFELDKNVFQGKFSKTLLYQALNMYRANQRAGTADTKTRGEVRGSGKKPWRQKGTGRARVGSIRTPVWRGGGIVFGPHPRDYRYTLPKKLKRNAFIASINAKLKAGKVIAVEGIEMNEPKTKKISGMMRALKIRDRSLLLIKDYDKNIALSCRNVHKLTLKKFNEATVLDVLSCDNVIITKDAAEALNKSVKK